MYRKAALSGSVLHPAKLTILRNEIDTTQPEESATGAITLSGITEGASLCEGGKIYWNARYGCQEIGILAIADYSIPPIDVSIKPTNLDIRTSTGMIVGVPIVSATPMVM